MDDRMEAYFQLCRDTIAEHGHMVQYVGGSETRPGWSYTIGLHQWEHPEVTTFALSPQVGQSVLNDLAGHVRAGNGVRHGEVRERLLRDLPVAFIDVVDTGTDFFNVARALLRRERPTAEPVVQAIQLVWPDGSGRFPWDDGYHIDPVLQPLLGEVPDGLLNRHADGP